MVPPVIRVLARKNGDVSILDCSGEVDLHSSTRLREALVTETDDHVPALLVNLTDVSYIDSSGIATLLEGLQLSKEAQTRLGLYGLRTNALYVLKLARLETVFTIFATEQEAVEKITEP
jgi:anti-sigma B factor antagonist